MRLYLGAGFRWANAMGPVRDPRIMDWRNALDGPSQKNTPEATSDAARGHAPVPGGICYSCSPSSAATRWGAPPGRSSCAAGRRSGSAASTTNARLVRVLTAPRFNKQPRAARGVRAVLYEAVP